MELLSRVFDHLARDQHAKAVLGMLEGHPLDHTPLMPAEAAGGCGLSPARALFRTLTRDGLLRSRRERVGERAQEEKAPAAEAHGQQARKRRGHHQGAAVYAPGPRHHRWSS